MSDLLTQDLKAGIPAVFPGGLFFKLVKVTGQPVNLEFERRGAGNIKADSAPAGYTVGPLPETRRFARVRVTSLVDQTVTVLVGDDAADVTGIDVILDAAVTAGAQSIFMNIALALTTEVLPFNATAVLNAPGTTVRGYLIHAPSANPNPFYISTFDINNTSEGMTIEPGDTQWFPSGYTVKPGLPKSFLHVYSALAGGVAEITVFYKENL